MTIKEKMLATLSVPFLLLLSAFKRTQVYQGTCPQTHKWYKKELETGTASDGSRYYTYFKKGTVNKTAVYFGGGGASWNAYTAARPGTIPRMLLDLEGYYFPFIRYYMELWMKGLVAANDARNPINDYNVIYLPYATGDFHIGQNDFPYRDRADRQDRTLRHQGLANVRAALDAAPQEFFSADTVFIGGESAGAFAAAAWTPELTERFPSCERFVLLTDGGQVQYLDWPHILRDVWQTEPRHFERLRDDGQLMRDWLLYLHKNYGERLTCLYSCSPYDEVLSQFENKLNGGAFKPSREGAERFHRYLTQAVDEMLREIPTFRVFIYNHGFNKAFGTTAHTIAREPKNLFKDQTDGFTVSEWIARSLAGEDVPHIGLDRLELLCPDNEP
jgi:hypothetical protein